MAVLFQKNIRNFMSWAFISQGTNSTSYGLTTTYAITVFSGVQPSASTIQSSWSSYNTTFLCHWQGVILYNVYSQSPASSGYPQGFVLQNNPGSVTAINSGTASWCILWPTNPTQATVSGSSLPSTKFMVGPVSNQASNGLVRFISTSFTSGSSYSINDINLILGGGV